MCTQGWILEENSSEEEFLARRESLFSIGNGYLGFRGFFCEREPAHHPGVYINGFYELSPIHYGENAHGFARFNQTMLDLPDCRCIELIVDGEPFRMHTAQISAYRRVLDFRKGKLTRTLVWHTKSNARVACTWETLISCVYTHLGCVKLTLQSDRTISINIRSSISMPIVRPMDSSDPRVGSIDAKPSLSCMESEFMRTENEGKQGFQASFRTIESALHLTCGAYHTASKEMGIYIDQEGDIPLPALLYSCEETQLSFEKCFYYHTCGRSGEEGPLTLISTTKEAAAFHSWESLIVAQEEHYDQFWRSSDVVIEGDPSLQQALRFNLFQLHQSCATDAKASLAAKGLTGLGYEGHYFWDTEIYGMPFFTHTSPATARALILYRVSILEHARARARELSQKGILFPWRTINGLEASAYFPAGTAQYHINADIVYSIMQYMEISGDYSILKEGVAEILFETARFWYDIGFFNERKGGAFCIAEVTGPDEYSALVDNNCYTNVMARYNLQSACTIAQMLSEQDPHYWQSISSSLQLHEQELKNWEKAQKRMYIPFDTVLGIHPQDDSFLDKKPWNRETQGEIRHPMLLHYHPLVIYRHQVIKQADTVLAMFLLSDQFPLYIKKRNFSFYEPVTTGDSSLSACIQGIVAFDCGDADLAYAYCQETALMDIEDIHRNTKDGLHTAAMAGSWMAMVYGIAGYRNVGGLPSFRPHLPKHMHSLTFHMYIRNILITVTLSHAFVTYRVSSPITIRHRSETVHIEQESSFPAKAHTKAVIFDLDGVITSTDDYHYRAWKTLTDRQGWDFDEHINEQLRGVSRRESLMIILRHNKIILDEPTIEKFLEEKNTWYRESLLELTPSDILPGILNILKELKKRNIKTAIASASKNAPMILERLALTHYFDVIVPPGDVIKGKPDPEIFLRAAEALGVYPEECSAVEDAPAGMQAILSAHMRSVGVGAALKGSQCDVYVPSTADLTVFDLIVP